MIIAASAPLTVVAGGVPSNFAVTGLLGIPLSFVLLGVVLILFAIGYAAMSRHVHNAGAFFAYIAKGLGKPAGVGAALTALVAYNAMQIGIAGMFGFVLSSLLDSLFGLTVPWGVCALIAWAVVGLMGVARVDFSAKVLGIIVSAEFLIVIVFDLIGLVQSPEASPPTACCPTSSSLPGSGRRWRSRSRRSWASNRGRSTTRRSKIPGARPGGRRSSRSASSPGSMRSPRGRWSLRSALRR